MGLPSVINPFLVDDLPSEEKSKQVNKRNDRQGGREKGERRRIVSLSRHVTQHELSFTSFSFCYPQTIVVVFCFSVEKIRFERRSGILQHSLGLLWETK